MRGAWITRIPQRLSRIGAFAAETEDERVRRLIWLTTLLVGTPASLALGVAFLWIDNGPGAAIALAGAAFWAGQVIHVTRRQPSVDSVAFVSQLSCVAISVAGTLAMGGPARSGGLIIFGLIGPLYALAFPSRRRALIVLSAYLLGIAVAVTVDDRAPGATPLPALANRIFFGLMLVLATSFGSIALYVFVTRRDRALALLRQAEERIAQLLESAPGAADTVAAWSRSMARDVAAALGARAIGIWELTDAGPAPLAAEGLPAPSAEAIQQLIRSPRGTLVDTAQGPLLGITGTTGDLCGVLLVAGLDVAWTSSGRHLVASLAHQVGAAIDMARMRALLAAADERRALTRQALQAQGVATLHVCPRCGRCFDDTRTACPDDGATLGSPRPLPYRLLNRYRFLRVLGEGGMGTVLATWDEKLDRAVAVKLIRPEHFNNLHLRQRFAREARAIARIQHPGVIALFDSGELEDGTAFIVMEQLPGRDLASQLRAHGRGAPAQVAELARQGCAALRAAHLAGVVHRDVKPENIFLVNDAGGFRVKILDFGLAKSMAFEGGVTQTGMLLGTPAYMSPEQVQGEAVDARSDVYSFAAVCYEALTGRKAVTGADLGSVLINVLNTVPPPPSSTVPGIGAGVDAAFSSALAKDPARRLKDIALWGSCFVDALAATPFDPQHPGWPAESARSVIHTGSEETRIEASRPSSVTSAT